MHSDESQKTSAAQKAVEGRQKGEGAGVWGKGHPGRERAQAARLRAQAMVQRGKGRVGGSSVEDAFLPEGPQARARAVCDPPGPQLAGMSTIPGAPTTGNKYL